MKILDTVISKSDLKNSQNLIDDFAVKGVVDIKKKLLAIDAELHADLEQFLLENGSDQADLWGINLYFDETDPEEFIEFDSLINIRPLQKNTTRGVENPDTRKEIISVVDKWIK